jgi:hypothetical protein
MAGIGIGWIVTGAAQNLLFRISGDKGTRVPKMTVNTVNVIIIIMG